MDKRPELTDPTAAVASVAHTALNVLKEEPAYALVFAIYGLFTILGSAIVVYGMVEGHNEVLVQGLIAFVIASGSAVYTVHIIEKYRSRLPARITRIPAVEPEDEEVESFVVGVTKDLNKAVRVQNSIFKAAVLEQCAFFRSRSADWAQGHLLTSGEAQYNRTLVELYENASSDVFATSAPEYLDAWSSPLGQRLKEAHKKSRASVKRVFIFNARSEVTAQALQEMSNQDEIDRVEVLLYFDQEDNTFIFSTDISRDFTIVDNGDAVGVTRSFAHGGLEARWYFKDAVRSEPFLQTRDALLRGSISFSRYKREVNG